VKTLIASVCFALAANSTFAALVSVRTKSIHGTCGEPTVTAAAVCESCSEKVTGRQSLELDDQRHWTLSAKSSGCWSEEIEVAPVADLTANVRLWPAAQMSVDLPPRVAGEVLHGIATAAPKSATEFRGATECVRRNDNYLCTIPAGVRVDVRFDLKGYAPLYAFDVASMRGEAVHLAFTPIRGASIRGSVETKDGHPIFGAAISVVPNAPASPEQRLPLRTLATKTNERGFFQIAGVVDGEYAIVSRVPGMSVTRTAPVAIKGTREHSLVPIVQRPLQQLTVWITPSVDGVGRPWHVALDQEVEHSGFVRTVADKPALVTGEWRQSGVDAGEYWLVVQDANGNKQEQQRVTLASGDEHLNVTIRSLVVRGRVHAGNDGLPSSLSFRQPGHSVKADTDAEGTFVTVLPADGHWSVNVISKDRRNLFHRELSIAAGNVDSDGYIRADIALPPGTVSGRVVDRKGDPVPKAIVFASREGQESAQAAVDDEGNFRIVGLEPGSAILQASRIGRGQSEPLPVEVSESTGHVTLTYSPFRNVRGAVATLSGEPIAGAILRFLSPAFSKVFEVVSGPGGRFSVELPETEAVVTAVVLPGMYPARIVTMSSASLDEDVSLVVGNDSGALRVLLPGAPPWPMVSIAGSSVPLTTLLYPSDGSPTRRGFSGAGIEIDIEPGAYTVCRTPTQCRMVSVPRHGEAIASFMNEEPHRHTGTSTKLPATHSIRNGSPASAIVSSFTSFPVP
jgi:hypothetical protein